MKEVKGYCHTCEDFEVISLIAIGNDSIGDENQPISTQITCTSCKAMLVVPGTELLEGII